MSNVDVIARIEADVDGGGWQATGLVIDDADLIDYDQAIEVWFDLYLEGSGWEALPRPAFSGHLAPEPWEKRFQASRAPFKAFTGQEFMKRKEAEVQGIFFKDVALPANEHQVNGLTYSEIVEHLCGKSGQNGHCNLVEGIWPEGFMTLNLDAANSSAVDSYDLKHGNFWARLKELAQSDFYYLFVDKTNRLNFTEHPMFGTLPTPVLTLTSSHLLEPLNMTRRNTEQVGQVKLRGTTPNGLQITGVYPTDPQPGPAIERAGYMGTSDTLMDGIAERMFKFENRDYSVVAKVAGGLGLMVDLMDRIGVTYSSSEDGIAWSEKKFWIHKIVVELLANFTARSTLHLEAENA